MSEEKLAEIRERYESLEERLLAIRARSASLGETPAPCAMDGVLADVPWLVDAVGRLQKNVTKRDNLVALCRDVVSQAEGLVMALRDVLNEEASDE